MKLGWEHTEWHAGPETAIKVDRAAWDAEVERQAKLQPERPPGYLRAEEIARLYQKSTSWIFRNIIHPLRDEGRLSVVHVSRRDIAGKPQSIPMYKIAEKAGRKKTAKGART